jgi:DNA-binding response OmpR family regulator
MNREKINILLAEDDVNLGFVVRDNLEQHGFFVDLCKDGESAFQHFRENKYHICILDVMMPLLDGFSLAAKIRESDRQIPILFLTAKTLKEDKIQGFMLGGDDYITKPFSIEELIFRIQVFLKRSHYQPIEYDGQIVIGNYVFDPKNLHLTCDNDERVLTQMEANILYYLYKRKDEVVRRNDILKTIWGDDDYFMGRSLDVFISRLRKYLSSDHRVQIANVHGVGFKLHVPN